MWPGESSPVGAELEWGNWYQPNARIVLGTDPRRDLPKFPHYKAVSLRTSHIRYLS